MTGATFQLEQNIKPGALEIDDTFIPLADCAGLMRMGNKLLETMKTVEINEYSPRSVIQAHEDTHAAISRKNVQELYGDYVKAIEAITVPCQGNSYSSAKEATKAKVLAARGDYLKALNKREDANVDHKPKQEFLDAHIKAALPWYEKIRKRMKEKNCPETLPDPPKPSK